MRTALLGLALFIDISGDPQDLSVRNLRELKSFRVEGGMWRSQGTMGEDGTQVACYTEDKVLMTNALTGEKILELPTNGNHPHDGATSPDGKYYAVTYGAQIQVYDLRSGKEYGTFQIDADFC
jgi:hypothetical protein